MDLITKAWIVLTFLGRLVLVVICSPALLDPRIGMVFALGLGGIAAILFRNAWKRTSFAVAFISLLQIYGTWSISNVAAWKIRVRDIPQSISKGSTEADVEHFLAKHSSIMSTGQMGTAGDRHIDIAPPGPGGVISGQYWRVILRMDSSKKTTGVEVVQVEP